MEEKQALSDVEIVGIAVAAAAALGGLVIGLSRGQDRATEHPVESNAATSAPAELLATRARRGLAQVRERYPMAPDAARESIGRTRRAIERADRRTGLIPVSRQDGRMGSVVQRVTPYVTSGMAGALESASDALQRLSIDPEKAREESRDRIQERGSRMRAQLEESLVPAARERSEAVLGRAREAVGGVTSSDSSSRGTLESVANRGQGAASAVARGSSYAAKETGATVIWLGIASALVYLILLSPERREQVKSFLCSAYEQARLLALDFRGYEPEM